MYFTDKRRSPIFFFSEPESPEEVVELGSASSSETRPLVQDVDANIDTNIAASNAARTTTHTSSLDIDNHDATAVDDQLELEEELEEMGRSYDLPSHHSYKSHSRSGSVRLFLCGSKPMSRRRSLIYTLAGIVALFFLSRYAIRYYRRKYPPLYEAWHARELTLPQHNLDLPYPEGKHGKYVWVSNQLNEYGWGNFMQELLMDAYLVHKAGRTFVFGNYTWNRHGPEYSTYKGRVIIPSRVPLTAMLAGPIVGDPFPPGDHSPRSVRAEFFEKVCPNPVKIRGDEISKDYVWGSATILVEKWIEKFNSIEDPCIEIEEGSMQLFSMWVFGSTNLLDIWSDLLKSPMVSQFRFSPLIEYGFAQNIHQINPLPGSESLSYGSNYPYTPVPGLLVLQLRRGDYVEHCVNLLNWGANWQGFNKFPEFPDQFQPVPGAGSSTISDEARAEHMKRCYPTPEQIAKRVKEILETEAGKGLKNVYLMTNGKEDFIQDVKRELGKVHQWGSVMSSRDLVVSWEQEYVKQAIDMLIGLRSQVLIGNGWSSMSSNIVMLRMALSNLSPDHHRFF